MSSNIVYIGLKAHVAAIDKVSGATLWKTKLQGGGFASGTGFVNLLVEDGLIYAHTQGHLFCLDADEGRILWKNGLEGLGYEIASLATEASSGNVAQIVANRNKQVRQASTGV